MADDLPLERWRSAAAARGHRCTLVLTGDRRRGWRALEGLGDPARRLALAPADTPLPDGWDRISPRRPQSLLGQGIDVAAVDLHRATELSAICVAAGALRAGGLLVLLAPPADRWGGGDDELTRRLAPPPFGRPQVGRHTVGRLRAALEESAGVAWVDLPEGEPATVRDPAPGPPAAAAARTPPPAVPPGAPRRGAAPYAACRPAAQWRALRALEALAPDPKTGRAPPVSVVLTADRGRGKSSALGLAASGLLRAGARVAVTGPGPDAAAEVRQRCAVLGAPLPYLAPSACAHAGLDALLVDEAAALSVPVLRGLADAAPAVAFATTVRGYEGTGQGFAVRFRAHLERRPGRRVEVELSEPIRWAPGDPLEAWVRRAFLLDAEPAPTSVVEAEDQVRIREWPATELVADGPILRQLFGLLVHAHYRTVPEDLARLLDGPNVRALLATSGGHVAGALLLAHEGGLDRATCDGLAAGSFRLRGNMLPETLTCHLAEPDGARLRALRVLRLAIHPDLRRRGIGRRLLTAGEALARDAGVDYLGAGYAATPGLLRFWSRCGYTPARVAVTRSPISGEHSAVVLRGVSEPGCDLTGRLCAAFLRRFPHVLADALRDLDPEVAVAALAGLGRPAPRWRCPPTTGARCGPAPSGRPSTTPWSSRPGRWSAITWPIRRPP